MLEQVPLAAVEATSIKIGVNVEEVGSPYLVEVDEKGSHRNGWTSL